MKNDYASKDNEDSAMKQQWLQRCEKVTMALKQNFNQRIKS